MSPLPRYLHVLLVTAAVSVSLGGLAATGHYLGWLPKTDAPAAPEAVVAPASPLAQADKATPVSPPQPSVDTEPTREPPAKPAHGTPRLAAPHPVKKTASVQASAPSLPPTGSVTPPATVDAPRPDLASLPPPPPPTVSTPPVCRECGVVEGVRESRVQGQGSALGAVAGGVLGGLLGHQMGRGSGKDLATIAGAVGGAFAGNQVERQMKTETQYEITVRFDDGNVHTYTQRQAPVWHQGDRVRLSNGQLAPGA